MSQNTSKIQIQTENIKITGENLSEQSTQAILDFMTLTEIRNTKQMKHNFIAVIVGLIISLSFGVFVFTVTQKTTEVQSVK